MTSRASGSPFASSASSATLTRSQAPTFFRLVTLGLSEYLTRKSRWFALFPNTGVTRFDGLPGKSTTVSRLLTAFQASEQRKADREAVQKAELAGKDADIAELTAQLAAVQVPAVTLSPEAQAILDKAIADLAGLATTLEAPEA